MSDVEVHIELAGVTKSVGLLRHHASGRGETATFALGYAVVEHARGESATHVVLARQAPPK